MLKPEKNKNINYELSDKMSLDHEKIDKFINKVKTEEEILKLKFMLERHFLIEEKAIFELYYTEDEEDRKIIPILMKQHKEILAELKTKNLAKIKIMLKKHSTLEDEKFYPLLDKTLTREKKEKMIEKIQSF